MATISLPLDLADHIIDLFDQLGFYSTAEGDDESPRLSVVTAISRLLTFIVNNTNHTLSIDEWLTDTPLLKLEELLRDVRQNAELFISSVVDERLSIQETCNQVKERSNSHVGWASLANQVALDFVQQSQDEEHLSKKLLATLDSFYSTDNPQALIKTLKSIAKGLQREIMRNGHVLRIAAQILQTNQLERFSGEVMKFEQPKTVESISIRGAALGSWPTNIHDLVKQFVSTSQLASLSATLFVSALVVGPKSNLCHNIEDFITSTAKDVSVLRPCLPLDFLGSSVGEAEDRLVAIFNASNENEANKTVIIMEDLDTLISVSSSQKGSGEYLSTSHLSLRLKSTLMHLIDSFPFQKPTLLLGTSESNLTNSIARFDFAFHVEVPDIEERKFILSSSLGMSEATVFEESQLLLLAESLVGRSYAELSQLCRDAIGKTATLGIDPTCVQWKMQLLDNFKLSIHKRSPESLRNGVIEDFVDMRVYKGDDLDAKENINMPFSLKLYGASCEHAWKELQRNIIIPLCRKRELDKLLDRDEVQEGKMFCGGLLLSGPPGCGKSAIAFEAAHFAARLLPSVTLIDVSCTSLIHKEVGGSEQAVRKLFASARQAAPCILLMDGIENIAATRGNDTTTEGSLDRVLSTLLIEMDGVEDYSVSQGGIAVIGITHNDQWIDAALKRPGRLSNTVVMRLPEEEARLKIVERELSNAISDDEIKSTIVTKDLMEQIARGTSSMTGAFVVAACNRLLLAISHGTVLTEELVSVALHQ